MRLPTHVTFPPYWANTGKFDKIAFSLSTNHHILGISVTNTVQLNIPVHLTIKLTDLSGTVIASKTKSHTFTDGPIDYPVFFDQPILLTAGQQYIAAALVEGEGMLPEMIYSEDGKEVTICNPHLNITFSNVPPGEFADSNNSTVEKGQISLLYVKPP